MKVRASKQTLKSLYDKVTWLRKRKVFKITSNGEVSIVSSVRKVKRPTKRAWNLLKGLDTKLTKW